MKSLVNKQNYVNIQGWMLTELNLKGNELLIYAIIYGFSQDESSSFRGSLQYLADWTNSTKQGVLKCIKILLEKNFIIKKEEMRNNIKLVEYSCQKVNTIKQSLTPMQQSLTEGIKQSLTNNIVTDNIEDNIEKNIKKENKKKEIEEKFNKFYKDYKKQVGRKQALITFTKLANSCNNLDDLVNEILKNYAIYEQTLDNEKYRVNPSRFLDDYKYYNEEFLTNFKAKQTTNNKFYDKNSIARNDAERKTIYGYASVNTAPPRPTFDIDE
jgi:hypothetical protein